MVRKPRNSVTGLVALVAIAVLLSPSLFVYESSARKPDNCFRELDIDKCPFQTVLFLLDREPPDITAPPDIKVAAEQVPVKIDIGEPIVFDNVDPLPMVTNNAPSDLMFPLGTTIVEWKAMDLMGNLSVDYQFVTVVRHPDPTLPFKPSTEPMNKRPFLKIDPIPHAVAKGDQVIITGKLIDANTGDGIRGVSVSVLDNRPIDIRTLGNAKTDDEGNFTFIWQANPTERWKDRHMSVIAKFDGSPTYARTVSYDRSMIVEVEKITLELFYTKVNYGSGERVMVFAAFKTHGDRLIDPDKMRATFDSREVIMIRKDTGIYEFVSLPPAKSIHVFTLKGEKFVEGKLPFGTVVNSVLIK